MDFQTEVQKLLSPGGILSQKFPNYEYRPGQIEFASKVWEALNSNRHLITEAPCGIGKTFAYLIPAIYFAREFEKKAIVCTANIALQEQLLKKDLPFLEELLPIKFSYALIKGMSNYLCLERLRSETKQLLIFKTEELTQQLKKLKKWAKKTKTGDKSELDFEPTSGLWNSVCANSELCTLRECPHFYKCFPLNARRQLQHADIIVCNYHLFLADLEVRQLAKDAHILPEYDFVIFDEAHNLPDVARDYFNIQLSESSVNILVAGARLANSRSLENKLKAAFKHFFESLSSIFKQNNFPVRIKRPLMDALAPAYNKLEDVILEYEETLKAKQELCQQPHLKAKHGKYISAGINIIDKIKGFLTLSDDNLVYFLSKEDTKIRVESMMLFPAKILSKQVFERVPSVIMTSATLAISRDFYFFKQEVGVEEAEELILGSPFDLKKQTVWVIPRVINEPATEGFAREVSPLINKIISTLNGKTLVLFTSYKNLKYCAEKAKQETKIDIIVQKDAPAMFLLEKFKQNLGSALFATSSFWQGVDVPGEALSCLIIDKLPFMPPDSPLIDAMQEKLGRECFNRFQLPKAIVTLRQGIGRLIRTKTDKGAVVIFDNRLLSARYARRFLDSIPVYRTQIHNDISVIFKFLHPH